MGAENSKPTQRERDHSNEIAIQRALEQQRKMYDAKYSEFIQSQIVIHESINQRQSSLSRNNSSTNAVSNSGISTSNTLYPNLQTVANNYNPQVATNINPSRYHASTSNNTVRPSTSLVFDSSAPKVPSSSVQSPCTVSSPQTTQSPQTIPSSHIVSTAPLISSNTITPNINGRNISNRGAIPKNRKMNNAQKKNASVGVECVTCKNDFGMQIYQCQNGHSSCNECRFVNRMCGLCSKPITDVRNITLETTIADMMIKQTTKGERIKCRNAKDGCCLSFTANNMDIHLKECPYNDMECPLKSVYNTCTWKGKINQISTHFNDVHPLHCEADVDKEMTLINVNIDQRLVYYVTIGSFNFLIHIKVIENEKVMYMTAQLLGTKVSASKWTYELHLYNKKQPRRKFQYNDICLSNVESVKDIFDKAQCAVVSLDYVKTFINDNCLTYKFFLKKNLLLEKMTNKK